MQCLLPSMGRLPHWYGYLTESVSVPLPQCLCLSISASGVPERSLACAKISAESRPLQVGNLLAIRAFYASHALRRRQCRLVPAAGLSAFCSGHTVDPYCDSVTTTLQCSCISVMKLVPSCHGCLLSAVRLVLPVSLSASTCVTA